VRFRSKLLCYDRPTLKAVRVVRFAFSFMVGMLIASAGGFTTASQQTEDLTAVLSRAAAYVAEYEDVHLGNVLAAENYLQEASAGRFGREQRRTQSDFLIVMMGGDRFGVRRVNRVDGAEVQSQESSFEAMMDDSAEGLRRRITALKKESAKYNIGVVQRDINLPTFALRVARKQESGRFAFRKQDTDKVSGVETWEVAFQERRSPTLVHGNQGESLLSSGALWIEPATGRILKTEFKVENPFSKPPVTAQVVVTYKPDAKLGMLVPAEMTERYDSDVTSIRCTANYSNFRPFKVEVSEKVGK